MGMTAIHVGQIISQLGLRGEKSGLCEPTRRMRTEKRGYGPRQHGRKWRLTIRNVATGKNRYESFDSREDAESFKRKIERAIARESYPISMLIEDWKKELTARGCKPESVKTSIYRMEAFFARTFTRARHGDTEVGEGDL